MPRHPLFGSSHPFLTESGWWVHLGWQGFGIESNISDGMNRSLAVQGVIYHFHHLQNSTTVLSPKRSNPIGYGSALQLGRDATLLQHTASIYRSIWNNISLMQGLIFYIRVEASGQRPPGTAGEPPYAFFFSATRLRSFQACRSLTTELCPPRWNFIS